MSDHPELDDYEPHQRPLRSPWLRRAIRVAAIVGILLLVMPLVASQARVSDASAQGWCKAWVAYEVDGPGVPEARFEAFGPGGLGWECYATKVIGGDRYIGNLGIIPGPPRVVLNGRTGLDA